MKKLFLPIMLLLITTILPGFLLTAQASDIAQSGETITKRTGTRSTIEANDILSPVISTSGGVAVVDVLENDLLNGNPVDPSDVIFTVTQTFANPGIILDPITRQVTVSPTTQPGHHFAEYRICVAADPTVCDQAFVYVFVSDLLDGYINQPEPLCGIVTDPASAFGMELRYQTSYNMSLYVTPLVADVDANGVPDIIAMSSNSISTSDPRSSKDINIYNGQTGALKYTITTPFMSWDGPTPFAVADVTGNGYAEIIIASLYARNAAADQRYLYCYTFDSNTSTWSQLWKSDVQYGVNAPSNGSASAVGIADFNQDGIPEVYVYNEIFNAQTGVRLAHGGAHGIGRGHTRGGVAQAIPVAADLTNSPGLELAAGRTVYEITVDGGGNWTMTPINFLETEIAPTGNIDGFTALADINLDGNLEVLVGHNDGTNSHVYAWNPRAAAGSQLVSYIDIGGNYQQHGAFFIGDIDGDGYPNIGLCQRLRIQMLQYGPNSQLEIKWTYTTNDASGRTGITMFDFNQNGIQEMVYRDETDLIIFDGAGAAPAILASFPVRSNTGMEGPVVADVTGNGRAEIIVSDESGSTRTGRIMVFQSSLDPWAPARGVWNQYAYFITHINDDLRIPQFQPNHGQDLFFNNQWCPDQWAARPLNMFNVQSTYFSVTGCPSFPVFDAVVELISATINCPDDDVEVTYRISNIADLASIPAGNPVAFYDSDPLAGGANVLHTEPLPATIGPGDNSGVLTVTFSFPGISHGDLIYAVANDDGSTSPSPIDLPTTNDFECDYTNNFDQIIAQCDELPMVPLHWLSIVLAALAISAGIVYRYKKANVAMK